MLFRSNAVLAKLDHHVRDSEILIKSFVLSDSVVFESKREAVKAELRSLSSRSESQKEGRDRREG